jgi:opacity protein-like surface antigen
MRFSFLSARSVGTVVVLALWLAAARDAAADDDAGAAATSADGGAFDDAGSDAAPAEEETPTPTSEPFQPAIVATPVVVATPVDTPTTTAAAAAPSKPGVGWRIGIRASWGFPFGTSKSGTSLSDVVPNSFTFGGDFGYSFSPHFYLGVYAMYGLGVGTSQIEFCSDPDISCSASVIRFGAVAEYHFALTPEFDPWVGGGIGYEVLNLIGTDQSGQGNDEAAAADGFEVIPRAGIDWKPGPSYGFGPFIEVPVGHYWDSSFTVHEWFVIGVRIHTLL